MKIFLKLAAVICAAMLCITGLAASAQSDEEKPPIYAEQLKDGEYDIEVDSSSSMFRVVECRLKVTEDKMTAVMTMSGQGYGMVFEGTGEQALAADETEYIDFVLNDAGQKTFEFPVEALDKKVNCAAWSIRKEKWYDRELVFKSDSLPEDAFENSVNVTVIIISAVALVVIAAVVCAVIIVRKRKRAKE